MGALLQFAKRLEDESFLISFQKAFEVLLASEQVLLLGTGYSGHLAGLGARMFRNVGRLALAADDPFPHISDVVAHRIVVIVISFSGETTQMLGMAKVFSEAGCPIIAVTSSPDSTLARLADITLATLALDLPVHDYLNFGTNAPTLYVLEMLVRRIWGADHMQEDGSSVAITRS